MVLDIENNCKQVEKVNKKLTISHKVEKKNDQIKLSRCVNMEEWNIENNILKTMQREENLDIPDTAFDQYGFGRWDTQMEYDNFLEDIIIAHKVIKSGIPNRWGCRIPINTNWNLTLMDSLLQEYEDSIAIFRVWIPYFKRSRLSRPYPK